MNVWEAQLLNLSLGVTYRGESCEKTKSSLRSRPELLSAWGIRHCPYGPSGFNLLVDVVALFWFQLRLRQLYPKRRIVLHFGKNRALQTLSMSICEYRVLGHDGKIVGPVWVSPLGPVIRRRVETGWRLEIKDRHGFKIDHRLDTWSTQGLEGASSKHDCIGYRQPIINASLHDLHEVRKRKMGEIRVVPGSKLGFRFIYVRFSVAMIEGLRSNGTTRI